MRAMWLSQIIVTGTGLFKKWWQSGCKVTKRSSANLTQHSRDSSTSESYVSAASSFALDSCDGSFRKHPHINKRSCMRLFGLLSNERYKGSSDIIKVKKSFYKEPKGLDRKRRRSHCCGLRSLKLDLEECNLSRIRNLKTVGEVDDLILRTGKPSKGCYKEARLGNLKDRPFFRQKEEKGLLIQLENNPNLVTETCAGTDPKEIETIEEPANLPTLMPDTSGSCATRNHCVIQDFVKTTENTCEYPAHEYSQNSSEQILAGNKDRTINPELLDTTDFESETQFHGVFSFAADKSLDHRKGESQSRISDMTFVNETFHLERKRKLHVLLNPRPLQDKSLRRDEVSEAYAKTKMENGTHSDIFNTENSSVAVHMQDKGALIPVHGKKRKSEACLETISSYPTTFDLSTSMQAEKSSLLEKEQMFFEFGVEAGLMLMLSLNHTRIRQLHQSLKKSVDMVADLRHKLDSNRYLLPRMHLHVQHQMDKKPCTPETLRKQRRLSQISSLELKKTCTTVSTNHVDNCEVADEDSSSEASVLTVDHTPHKGDMTEISSSELEKTYTTFSTNHVDDCEVGDEDSNSESSVLTVDHTPHKGDMTELEKELEAELELMELNFNGENLNDNQRRLSGLSDLNSDGIGGLLHQSQAPDYFWDSPGPNESNIDLCKHIISTSSLDNVLKRAKENQGVRIMELEAQVSEAKRLLQSREREILWWKDCASHLTGQRFFPTTENASEEVAAAIEEIGTNQVPNINCLSSDLSDPEANKFLLKPEEAFLFGIESCNFHCSKNSNRDGMDYTMTRSVDTSDSIPTFQGAVDLAPGHSNNELLEVLGSIKRDKKGDVYPSPKTYSCKDGDTISGQIEISQENQKITAIEDCTSKMCNEDSDSDSDCSCISSC